MRDSKHIVIGVAGFILLGSSFAERAVAGRDGIGRRACLRCM
jgi:hypothetical protein